MRSEFPDIPILLTTEVRDLIALLEKVPSMVTSFDRRLDTVEAKQKELTALVIAALRSGDLCVKISSTL